MSHDWFDEPHASRYDDVESPMFAADIVGPAVDLLVELAGDGSALEFAIGTGRIAIPLHARGVPVEGIDLSPAMLARLRAKPAAAGIVATQGDFATTRVSRRFRLVYLLFNTINNLTTQEEQVDCFVNAVRHLEPGGSFVVEVGVPDLQRLPFGETIRPFAVTDERLGFDEYDVVTQRLTSHHVMFGDGRSDRLSIPFRYVWPAELDLMARLAGMALQHRWADWSRAPFTATSTSHVSVWTTADRPRSAPADR